MNLRTVAALAAAIPLFAQVKLPPYERSTLANGITLILITKKEIPMVSLRAVLRGGGEADPADKAGLSALTAELLRRGTSRHTADQFSDRLDQMGAEFRATVDPQSTAVRMDFLEKDSAAALDLLAEAIIRPSFPAEEFQKALAEKIADVRASKDQPQALLTEYFRPFYFGASHPYGRALNGDDLSLARIRREDVLRQHERIYAGRNLSLVVAGEFDPGVMRTRIGSAFGAMAAGAEFAWTQNVAPPKFTAERLLLVDKTDATQTYFLIAMPGIDRTHSDWTVLWLINTLFGERFTSMLNDELRINSGLTYGAGSRIQIDRIPGAIRIQTFTKTDTTAQAINLALDVLKRLYTRGLTAEQLASAKKYVKGIYPTQNLETPEQVASVVGDLELFGMNKGEIDDLFSRIDAVNLEQANRAIKRYFQPVNLQFCLVGQASKIRETVGEYAKDVKVVSSASPGFVIP